MESKVCSYTEKNIRLQLVKVGDCNPFRIELRFNRKVINTWSACYSKDARLCFLSAVHEILVKRSSNLSYLT